MRMTLAIGEGERRNEDSYCTFCHQYGRRHKDCFAKLHAKRSYQRAILQCRKCDQFGHAHFECPHHHQIIMFFLTQLMIPSQSQPSSQHFKHSGPSWNDTASSWKRSHPPSDENVKAESTSAKVSEKGNARKPPKKPFSAPILSSCSHCFQKFPSRNKLFKHLRSDCILAQDDPKIDSAIKATVLPKP